MYWSLRLIISGYVWFYFHIQNFQFYTIEKYKIYLTNLTSTTCVFQSLNDLVSLLYFNFQSYIF